MESIGLSIITAAQLPPLPGPGSLILIVLFLRAFPTDVVTKSTKILASETVFQRDPIYDNDDHRKDKKTQIHKKDKNLL